MDIETVARKYALKNAIEFEGQANPGAVIGKIFAELDIANEDKKEVQMKAQKIVKEVNDLSLEEQEEEIENYEFEEVEKEEHDPIPDLKDAEDEEVVVRFAPNPNGPPHLGHARGMTINGELKEKYEGKLILRYDDTDPVIKRPIKEAYEMYEEDYKWLGYEPDEVRYASKNFDKYIEYAEKLIEMGEAYVSKASQEEMQEHRREGTASKYRSQSAEKNMDLWKKMKNGDIDEGEAVLKVKTDLDHKNPAVRDFVAFRIIDNPEHPITGNKYRVWPLLDFQGAIEDHLMGTTHIVRGKDLRASTKRQKYIYKYFDWEYPHVKYWGTVQVSGFKAPLSGSSIAELIDKNELSGWEDPRCGTLRALRRRGFQPEAIQNYFIEMGFTENDLDASLKSLETQNRDIIDGKANRYFFVEKPKQITIEGISKEKMNAEIDLHPDDSDRGQREHEIGVKDKCADVFIDKSDYDTGFYRLKGLCNIKIEEDGVKFIEGDHKVALEKNAEFIHWVSVESSDAEVLHPDGSVESGKIESNNIEVDEVVQFERYGFVRKDGEKKFVFAHK